MKCIHSFNYLFVLLQVVHSSFISRKRFLVRPNEEDCVFEKIREEDLWQLILNTLSNEISGYNKPIAESLNNMEKKSSVSFFAFSIEFLTLVKYSLQLDGCCHSADILHTCFFLCVIYLFFFFFPDWNCGEEREGDVK